LPRRHAGRGLKDRGLKGIDLVDREMTFRDAVEADAAELSEIGRDTFVETFGRLYPPADLKRYLDETYAVEKMLADIRDPEVEVRVASAASG
jgi:hypothetical protein